ncbi:hypothetical protein [Nonomuraea sp. NPDC049625]|uniref:hypothetical protein n=1 Tax=Nonomuraea sp. NPDC049625 TaxID=3155775 RepID=UPI0034473273
MSMPRRVRCLGRSKSMYQVSGRWSASKNWRTVKCLSMPYQLRTTVPRQVHQPSSHRPEASSSMVCSRRLPPLRKEVIQVVEARLFSPGQPATTKYSSVSWRTRYGAAVHTLPFQTWRRTAVAPSSKRVFPSAVMRSIMSVPARVCHDLGRGAGEPRVRGAW